MKLTFHQTKAEVLVRAASTVLFGALQRIGTPQKTLAELTETPQYGFTASSSIEPLGPKFVRITDIQDGAINWDSVPYCECLESDKYLLKPNDILFARTGATTGKTYLVKETPFAIFASYLIRIRPKSDISPAYIYSFFQSDLYWSQIAVEKEGSAQPNVNGKKLSTVEMPIVDSTLQSAIATFLQVVRDRQDSSKEPLPELPPPLSEQRSIVARIEELAAKIEEARGLRKKAGEETKALWESSLITTFNELSKICPNKIFRDFCDVVRGGSPRPAGSPVYYEGHIPFLKVADLTKYDKKYVEEFTTTIKEAGLSRSRYVEHDTLLLTNSGATLGVPKITTFGTCFNDGVQAFLNIPDDIFNEYLYYFFRSNTQWFRDWAARGQGQPNLNTDMVKEMQVPYPSLTEQRRIVAYLDELQVKVDALRRLQAETGAELDALLPAVLDRAFKGEL